MRKRTRKPVPVHNLKVTRKGKVRKRSIVWRWRRAFYLVGLVAVFGFNLIGDALREILGAEQ